MKEPNGKIENRLSTLEANYANLSKDINEIKTNHLVHIDNKLDELKEGQVQINIRMAYWSGGIVVALWVLEKFF